MKITEALFVLILSVFHECYAPVTGGNTYPFWRHLFYPDRQIEKVKIFEGPPIRCEVSGSRPEPKITWSIGERKVAENQYSVYTSEEDSLKVISKLKITLSEREKLEWISCSAKNPEFPTLDVSSSIRVAFEKPAVSASTTTTTTEATPGIESVPDSKVDKVEILKGPPIRCVASGSRPEPTITWTIDSEEVPAEKYTYNYDKDSLKATSNLTMELSKQGKSVKLTCVAKNPKFSDLSSLGSIHVTIPDNSNVDNQEVKPEEQFPEPSRYRGSNVISDAGAIVTIGGAAVGGAAVVVGSAVVGTAGIALVDAGIKSIPGSSKQSTESETVQGEANGTRMPEVSVDNNDQKNLVTNQTIADIVKEINDKFELMNITVLELRQHLINGTKYQGEFEKKYKEPAKELYKYAYRIQKIHHGPTMKKQHDTIVSLLIQFRQEMVGAVATTHLFRHVLNDFQNGTSKSIDPASKFRGEINELGKNAKGVTLDIFKEINEIASLSDFYTKKITECLKQGILSYSLSSEDMKRKVVNGFRELETTVKILEENPDNSEKWLEESENLKKSIREGEELTEAVQKLLAVREQSLNCTDNLAKSMQERRRDLLPKIQACFI